MQYTLRLMTLLGTFLLYKPQINFHGMKMPPKSQLSCGSKNNVVERAEDGVLKW